jgi:hypothetical protein
MVIRFSKIALGGHGDGIARSRGTQGDIGGAP